VSNGIKYWKTFQGVFYDVRRMAKQKETELPTACKEIGCGSWHGGAQMVLTEGSQRSNDTEPEVHGNHP
jgi:hypothetical protein